MAKAEFARGNSLSRNRITTAKVPFRCVSQLKFADRPIRLHKSDESWKGRTQTSILPTALVGGFIVLDDLVGTFAPDIIRIMADALGRIVGIAGRKPEPVARGRLRRVRLRHQFQPVLNGI